VEKKEEKEKKPLKETKKEKEPIKEEKKIEGGEEKRKVPVERQDEHAPKYRKKNGKNKEEKQGSKEPDGEKHPEEQKEEQKEAPKDEVEKKPQVSAFVPDQNFAWDLDLDAQPQKGKKKKATVVHVIKNANAAPAELKEEVKLKLSKEIDFEILSMSKVNKGLTNDSNCCFMNVCIQSLMACPPFFNMLVKISERQDVISDLHEESLLRKFVFLSKYFNP